MGRGGTLAPLGAALLLLAPLCAAQVDQDERIAFIGVALDVETRQADRILQDYLYRTSGVAFAPEELEYARVIDRLSTWKPDDGHYLARTTPYVYVVAEMLGADFEILATYTSTATKGTTYSAYFVVRREPFASEPDLQRLVRFLEEKPSPATFAFHDKFSTSSFLLPMLYLKSHDIFNMEESTESLTAIHARPVPGLSSSQLVELVASGQTDLAAVWDGARAKFQPGSAAEAVGQEVYFIRLPSALPNDLLVCSKSLAPETKERIRAAIRSMAPDEIGTGDFERWVDIRDATAARRALGGLRWLARETTAPVTVNVGIAPEAGSARAARELVEATRQAVRLAGSEFVLFDGDFHEHIDFQWVLEPIHDGALNLRSTVPGSGLPEQQFQISFRDVEGLTKRISGLIHDRMHRIRYVWPYSDDPPIVIRDTSTSIPSGEVVKVQHISWLDPQKNSFRGGAVFDARIRASDFYKYQLETADLKSPDGGDLELDAMSNRAYRVILVRPETESPLFRNLTVAFVTLLALAAAAAVIDLRRAPASPAATPASRVDSDVDSAQHLAGSDPARTARMRPHADRWH